MFSFLLLAAIGGAAILCLVRPFVGLLVFVAMAPFYSVLREASAGSPVFFIWPYLLTGLLMLAVAFREATTTLAMRGIARPEVKLLSATVVMAAALTAAAEASSGAVSAILTDTSLASMTQVVSGTAFGVTAALAAACVALFLVQFFTAMRIREGSTSRLDVVVAAFVVYGMLQVVNTWLRGGLLFTGLNGFRYYFIGAALYFPARYLMTDGRRHRQFLFVLLGACVAGAIQMLLESYLLNVSRIPPAQMPWVGHLFAQFNFAPQSDVAFFEGYRPMGFMYMTHVSGLYLLLGLALCVPKLVAARNWREAVPYLLLALVLVTGAVWASRTVIVIMVTTYVAGALMVPASSVRRAVGLVALIAFMLLASRYFIPGARYDLVADAAYLGTRAVPSLLAAIAIDLRQMVGAPIPATSLAVARPGSWHLATNSGTVRADREQARSGPVSVAVISGEQGAIYRDIIPVTPERGRRARVEAWVKAFPGTIASLRVDGGLEVKSSERHRADGAWELMSTEVELAHPDITMLGVDVQLERGTVFLDQVAVHINDQSAAGARMVLLGPHYAAPAGQDPAGQTRPSRAPPAGLTALPSPKRTSPGFLAMYTEVLFGRGAQFTDWNLVFFGKEPDRFEAATYSDTKYLEFGEQFGLIGLALLLALGGVSLWRGCRAALREADLDRRIEFAALTLMLVITFISLIHLPALFKTGYNTAVFVALAVLGSARLVSQPRAAASVHVVSAPV